MYQPGSSGIVLKSSPVVHSTRLFSDILNMSQRLFYTIILSISFHTLWYIINIFIVCHYFEVFHKRIVGILKVFPFVFLPQIFCWWQPEMCFKHPWGYCWDSSSEVSTEKKAKINNRFIGNHWSMGIMNLQKLRQFYQMVHWMRPHTSTTAVTRWERRTSWVTLADVLTNL